MTTDNGSVTDQGTQTDQGQQATAPQDPKPEIPAEVAAALKKANKEAETLRLRLKEIEDRDKSEAQKLADRLAEADRRAADAEAKALRAEVAAAKGVPARFLTGATQDELEASADEFLTEVDKRAKGRTVDVGQGARHTAQVPIDGNDWMRQKARNK